MGGQGPKDSLLPRYAMQSPRLAWQALCSIYSRYPILRIICSPWTLVVLLLACNAYGHAFPSSACPPGHLCIPNDVGGAPSRTTPYVEYMDTTATAAVYRVSSLIKTVQSPFQLIQVYESLFFGKILTIDGALMITERDEPNYHETIVNTPLVYLPEARRVLVIGGGDGGTVTQLVRHSNLVEIVWVEIDEQVIDFAREFFPRNTKALSDPRVKLRVQNAATFVQEVRLPPAKQPLLSSFAMLNRASLCASVDASGG
jgi:hypothetical protein